MTALRAIRDATRNQSFFWIPKTYLRYCKEMYKFVALIVLAFGCTIGTCINERNRPIANNTCFFLDFLIELDSFRAAVTLGSNPFHFPSHAVPRRLLFETDRTTRRRVIGNCNISRAWHGTEHVHSIKSDSDDA